MKGNMKNNIPHNLIVGNIIEMIKEMDISLQKLAECIQELQKKQEIESKKIEELQKVLEKTKNNKE